MKFTIETKILSEALRKASAAVSNRNLLPILGNVRLEATDETVTVSATDLDIFVTQKLPAEMSLGGSITVAHSYLSKLAARCQSPKITIATRDKNLRFTSGEIDAVLETLPSEEFPPAFPFPLGTKCEATEITRPFQKVSHAMSKETARYTMMGINILSEEKISEFCATDGRRIALFQTENLNLNGIVPDELTRAVLEMDFSDAVFVSSENGTFAINNDTVSVAGKLIEGRYVNYRQAIPVGEPKGVFATNRQELIEALRTCAIFTERQLPALQIEGKKKQIEVRKDAQATVTLLSAELASVPQFSIRFDSRFMLEALNACEDEVARIQCFKEADMIRWVMIGEKSFKAIIGLLR